MSNGRSKPLAGVFAVALVALGGCGGTGTVAPTSPGASVAPAAPAQPRGGDGAEPAAAGGAGSDWTVRRASPRELVVSFTGSPPGDGPCGARLRAVAHEDAASVRLSVVDDNTDAGPRDGEPVVCTAIGHPWALAVTLERDLAGRTVVDGDGTPVTVVDALAPSRLPAGYELTTESGSPSSYSLTYLSSDGGWLVVATWADDDVARAEGAFTLVEERDRDSRVYRLLENGMQRVVAVDVDDRRVWVSWIRQRQSSTATLGWDALLDVATSVR